MEKRSGKTNGTDDANVERGTRDGKDIKKLGDLLDMVEDCSSKVSFLDDFFANGHQDQTDFFSQDGISGLHVILRNLIEDLDWVWTGVEMIEEAQKRCKNCKLAVRSDTGTARPRQDAIDAARSTGKI